MTRVRPERFLTLVSAAVPGLRQASRRSLRVPVLMYHSVSEREQQGQRGYFQINTRPEVLEQHLACLKHHGYRSTTLPEMVRRLRDGDPYPTASVLITFDDGYADFHSHAFPLLDAYGFSATVYLPSKYIGARGGGLMGRRHLSWAQVRELGGLGVTFGSHTVSHARMTELAPGDVEREIVDSKHEIEHRTGASVGTFSYPFAFPEENRPFVTRLAGLLTANGYEAAVSTRIGTTHRWEDRYALRRIPANSHDDIRFFRAKLAGGYDWLRVPQYLYKKAKALRVARA